MYKTIDLKKNISELEEEVEKFWEENQIFQKSVEQRPESEIFYFYDGPPFATGLPHYGHLLAGTIKDVIPRYQTMLGKRVERRFGWDCHGLPVEFEVEKELNLQGKKDIEAMGIDKFNEYCRSIVLRYSNEWKKTVKRMGRWVELEKDYKTMDTDFMESIWWVCKTLWDKKLLYQSGKIVAYSARLNTPLSNFEVNLGYRDTQDPSITLRFPLREEENTYFLIWTTTPWTIPTNTAITVNPEENYSLVEFEGARYYIGTDAIERYFKADSYQVLKNLKGIELADKKYAPLFPYYEEHSNEAFYITLGDYVDSKTGTGLVHTATAFGEDDFQTGKKYKLPLFLSLNDSGEFLEEISDFQGLFFKDADKPIIRMLKEKGFLFHQSTIMHSYPFCWRSDSPLLYRWIPSWYVNVEQIKQKMLENNQSIHWKPEHVRNGRMGNWLENARDWAVSRNRYWGTPIPVWVCDQCKECHCIGSRQELEKKAEREIHDLHRHFIDDITWDCSSCDGIMRRTPEVLDCWFESGSMPYGQEHYPFENKEKFEKAFPANFISEGLDQTRGWFYTLLVLGTALFEKPAFQNCIVSGLVLAEDGKKMSKRLKNYPEPSTMINQYGADAIRLYMLNSGAIKAEELKFSELGLQDTLRGIILPLLNSLNFFATYASIDQWKAEDLISPQQLENPLDQWIVSKFHKLLETVRASLDDYDLNRSVSPFLKFIDNLTNWYIRRSRRRFWKSDLAKDKNQAYLTLHYLLKEFSKVIAPFIPFIAEIIYQAMKQEKDLLSVHLADYPKPSKTFINPELEEEMDLAIQAVEMGRTLRANSKLKVRQPLASITLIPDEEKQKAILEKLRPIIQEEINVHDVFIASDDKKMVDYSCRPNLPVLGPRYGKQMKILMPVLNQLSSEQIMQLIQSGESLKLEKDGNHFEITADDLLIDRQPKAGYFVENDKGLTLVLDTTLNPELIAEGILREVVNKIQQKRKTLELKVDQRIQLVFDCNPELQTILSSGQNYIQTETLASALSFQALSSTEHDSVEINETELKFKLSTTE